MNFTDALLNLATQTVIFAIALTSLAFRMKGNYKVHVVTMAVAVISGIVVASLGAAFIFTPSSMQNYTNPTLNLVTFVSHVFFGIASFVSGIILVALLLMDKAIAARTNLIAKATIALWVITYIVGISFLVILHFI